MLKSVQIVSFWSGFAVSGSVAKVAIQSSADAVVVSVAGRAWKANDPGAD